MQIGLTSASSSTEFHSLDTGPFRYMYMVHVLHVPWLYWTMYVYKGVTYVCMNVHIQVNALKLKRDTEIVGSKFGYLYA